MKKLRQIFFPALLVLLFIGPALAESINQLNKEGSECMQAGRYKEALQSFEKGLTLAGESGDKKAVAAFLGNIGLVYKSIGDYKKALECYEQSLAINRDTGDLEGELINLENIGTLHMIQGDFNKALTFYEKALSSAERDGLVAHQGLCLGNIGVLYIQSKNYNRAIGFLERGLSLAKKSGDVSGEGVFIDNLGRVYEQLGNLNLALGYYEKAIEITKQVGSKPREAFYLSQAGGVYSEKGEYQKALDNFERALAIYQGMNARKGEASVLLRMGVMYVKLQNYRSAMSHFEKAFSIYRELKNARGIFDSLEQMGILYIRQANYKAARECFELILSQARKLNDKDREAMALGKIALIYSSLGQYEESKDLVDKAHSLYRDLNDSLGEGELLVVKGDVSRSLGNFREALKCYEAVREIGVQAGGKYLEGTALMRMGLLYNELGDNRQARDYFQKARNIALDVGDIESGAANLLNIAATYINEGNYAVALKLMTEADEAVAQLGSPYIEANLYANLGFLSMIEGDFTESMACYTRAIEIYRKIGNRDREAAVLGQMGSSMFLEGRFKEALGYLDKALAISRECGDRSQIYTNCGRLGVCYKKMNQNEKALKNLVEAADILEGIRSEMSSEYLKGALMGHSFHKTIYESIIEILIEMHQEEKALEYAERGKARNFLEAMESVRVIPRSKGDKALAEQERALVEEIRNTSKALGGARGEHFQQLRDQLGKLYGEHENILVKIKLNNPEYASLISVSPAKISDIQAALAPGEVIIEYFVATDKTFVWAVGRDGVQCATVHSGQKRLEFLVKQIRKKIIRMQDEAGLRTALQQICALIVKPVEGALQGKSKLIIVPYGSLHYLPFSSLVNDSGHYLVEDYAILTEPSASSLVLFRKRKSSRPDGLAGFALGNIGSKGPGGANARLLPEEVRSGFSPLPGTKEELKVINEAFKESGKNSKCFAEEDFQVDKVKLPASQAGFVHFATHGFVSPQGKGRYSGLLASNGFIYVSDIFNWRLNADMVVLSACQTALGARAGGDDMVGLSRAFMQAGADNLVATLWSVKDEATRDFMVVFYRNILEGKGKSEALRQAQLEIMKKHPHPGDWSPFVLYGKDSQVQ